MESMFLKSISPVMRGEIGFISGSNRDLNEKENIESSI